MEPGRPTKICPSCGIEHVATAVACADCDVALIAWQPPSAPAEVPPAEQLAPLLRDAPWELTRVAEALGHAGIACRIDVYPPRDAGSGSAPRTEDDSWWMGRVADLCLYVPAERAEAAREIVARYREDSLHDTPRDEPEVDPEPLTECPACSAPLEGAREECPDCGLAFPALDADAPLA